MINYLLKGSSQNISNWSIKLGMIFRVLIFIFLIALPLQKAHACVAPPMGPTKYAVEKSDFVFEGEVVKIRKSYFPFSKYHVTKFKVVSVLKGKRRKYISVRHPVNKKIPGGWCNENVSFKTGRTYKVAIMPTWFFNTTNASYAESGWFAIN